MAFKINVFVIVNVAFSKIHMGLLKKTTEFKIMILSKFYQSNNSLFDTNLSKVDVLAKIDGFLKA